MKDLPKLSRFMGDGKFFHCRILNDDFEVYTIDEHWCVVNSYDRGEQIAHILNAYYEKYSYKLEEK
jgi:hypothetical protein